MERKRWPYMQYEWMAIDSKGTTVFDGRTGKHYGMHDPEYVRRLVKRLPPTEAALVLLWPQANQLVERLGFGSATTGISPEERTGHTRLLIGLDGYGDGDECIPEAEQAAKLLVRMLKKAGLDAGIDWTKEKYSGEPINMQFCGQGYVRVFCERAEELTVAEEVISEWSILKVNGLATTDFISRSEN